MVPCCARPLAVTLVFSGHVATPRTKPRQTFVRTKRYVTCSGTGQSAERFYDFLLGQQASIIQVFVKSYTQVLQPQRARYQMMRDLSVRLPVGNRGP